MIDLVTVRAPRHMVASADQLATQAGMAVLAEGGNAVDAAIAANAVLAVTGPHLCGLGGDLFALVHHAGAVHCLNSSGRAGSGADPTTMRAEGLREVPFRHDIRSVTVPGCVDGWAALHDRFATMPLARLLAPAIGLATDGFPASPLLFGSVALLDERGRTALRELADQATRPGARVRRPGAARALADIAAGGRDGFYGGDFGRGLLAIGAGWFSAADLARSQAEWVAPLAVDAFGVTLHTTPPNSQGYLLLAAARLAEQVGLPADPDHPDTAHLLIEAAKAAGHDRPTVLHDDADGNLLVAAAAARAAQIDRQRARHWPVPAATGDTTYLCAADAEGNAVSLIQSNASGFGSWLVEPSTGINLHNRGMAFSLAAGHLAELRAGARPPHTLSPAMATRDGQLAAVFGTMGGDAQPQVLLQLAARSFVHGQSPATAVHARRWALSGAATGFDTWTAADGPRVTVEGGDPSLVDALTARGHRVEPRPLLDHSFGHAHMIVRDAEGFWAGAADPRAYIGSVAGG